MPKMYEIAGDEVTWVSFWGNYLGGIISGIISFFILYLTFKKRDSEILEENKKFHNQKFKEDLASRVAHLNLMYLSTFLTSVDKKDTAEKLAELQNYHELINGDVETLDLLYLDEFPQYIKLYRNYVSRVNKILGDIGSFYIELQHQEELAEIKKIQDKILNENGMRIATHASGVTCS